MVVPLRRARTAWRSFFERAFFGKLGQRFFDAGETLVEEFLLDLENGNVESGGGRDLSDARAHQATTENSNFLYLHKWSLFAADSRGATG